MSNAHRFVRFISLLIGLTMSTLLPTSAAADDHIKVTKEVLLESGSAAKLNAIVKTHDGGYIIAGAQVKGWATRLDATGKVVWRYYAKTPGKISQYINAAVMPDDSVILCGNIDQIFLNSEVFITHLDKEGKVLSESLLDPLDEQKRGVRRLNACASIGDGVVLFVNTFLPGKTLYDDTVSNWVMTFNDKAELKYKKILPHRLFLAAPISARALPNQDTLLIMPANLNQGGIVKRITQQGDVVADSVPNGDYIQVESTISEPAIRLIPVATPKSSMIVMDDKLNYLQQLAGSVPMLTSRRAFFLPDHSLVLFGRQDYQEGSPTASISKISADLNSRSYQLIGSIYSSFQIEDAIPTGVPGEFVTIRNVTPTQQSPKMKPDKVLFWRLCKLNNKGNIMTFEKQSLLYHYKHGILFILTMPLALSGNVFADDSVARKSGLWETTTVVQEANLSSTTQECIDQASDNFLKKQPNSPYADCSALTVKHQGNDITFHAECKTGETAYISDGVFVGDLTKNYKGTITSTFTPPVSGVEKGVINLSAKWIGPCQQGQKPGSAVAIMPDNSKVDLNDPALQKLLKEMGDAQLKE